VSWAFHSASVFTTFGFDGVVMAERYVAKGGRESGRARRAARDRRELPLCVVALHSRDARAAV
jgi:hypothetical protein